MGKKDLQIRDTGATIEEEGVDGEDISVQLVKADGFDVREKWRNKKVLLCTNDETTTPKSGVVSLVHPYDIMNFQELGENHIGVIVEDSVSDSVKSSNNMLSISVTDVAFTFGHI